MSSLKPSARELEVLKLVAEGYTNPEIAKSLKVSRNTIKTHVRGLMNKFGVDRRVHLVAIALTSDSLENTPPVINKASSARKSVYCFVDGVPSTPSTNSRRT